MTAVKDARRVQGCFGCTISAKNNRKVIDIKFCHKYVLKSSAKKYNNK